MNKVKLLSSYSVWTYTVISSVWDFQFHKFFLNNFIRDMLYMPDLSTPYFESFQLSDVMKFIHNILARLILFFCIFVNMYFWNNVYLYLPMTFSPSWLPSCTFLLSLKEFFYTCKNKMPWNDFYFWHILICMLFSWKTWLIWEIHC